MMKSKDADSLFDQKVQAYRNLHKKCWSVRHKRKVVSHEAHVFLVHAKFHVSQAGRERVVREKRKNVHAWVEGKYAGSDTPSATQVGNLLSFFNKQESLCISLT